MHHRRIMEAFQIETYYHQGATYTWLHEPQNLYEARHISIAAAVQVINRDDTVANVQQVNGEERYKHIGLSSSGIITVITDHTLTRIITAWHSSTTEVKTWLESQ